MSQLPLLPTTVVGSHGKPGWWHTCKDLHDEGAWGSYDLAELLDDATDIAILDQERAGVDVISDGESRRLDGYVDGYYPHHRGHSRPSHGAPRRAVGIRPADALRGHRQDQRARRVGHRAGVRVPARPTPRGPPR